MKLPPGVDPECVALCEAINLYEPDIFTVESCCGHGKTPYHIYFKVEDLETLPHILYWFDGCHSGFYGWKVEVYKDCAKQYPTFMLEGPIHGDNREPINKPIDAYRQAEYIALCIRQDFFEMRFEQRSTFIKWLTRLFVKVIHRFSIDF